MNHRLKRGTLATAAVLVVCTTGCSNAPVAGFLDNCFPSKVRADGAPNPGPSVQPGGDGGLPKNKDDDKLPPPDFGPKP